MNTDEEKFKWLRKHAGHWEVTPDLSRWKRPDGSEYMPRVMLSAYSTAYHGRSLDEALEIAMVDYP